MYRVETLKNNVRDAMVAWEKQKMWVSHVLRALKKLK